MDATLIVTRFLFGAGEAGGAGVGDAPVRLTAAGAEAGRPPQGRQRGA